MKNEGGFFCLRGKISQLCAGLKAILSILVCASLLFLAFGKSALVLHYQLNKKAIAETRCENRDKPEMQCNGHCYLAKQLKKAAEKEAPAPDFRNLKELPPFLAAETLTTRHEMPVYLSNTPALPVSYGLPNVFSGSVFHPPEA